MNRERRLYFCRDYESLQPQWLQLSAGFYERKMSRETRKMDYFELGQEVVAQEEILDSVKVITLLGRYVSEDEAQNQLLSLHGERVGYLEVITEKDGKSKGNFSVATVCVEDDGSGLAEDGAEIRIKLLCGAEKEASVNADSFT